MELRELTQFLEQKFPLGLQAPYDNSGLQLGDLSQEINGVLVALDCTETIIAEAIEKNAMSSLFTTPCFLKALSELEPPLQQSE